MAKHRYSSHSPYLLISADFLVLISLFFLFLFLHNPLWERSLYGLLVFAQVHYKSLLLFGIFWFLVSSQVKLYNGYRFTRFLNVLKSIFIQFFLFAVVLFAISGGKQESLYTTQESIGFLSVLLVYLILSRFFLFYGLKKYRKKGFDVKNAIFIGCNENSKGLIELFSERKEFGVISKGVFVLQNPRGNQVALNLETLPLFLTQNQIDLAYISFSDGMDDELLKEITDVLENHYVNINFLPNSSSELRHSLEVNYLDDIPILTFRKYPLDFGLNQLVKRIFDIVFTLLAFLFLLWWLLPILSLMVYFSQGAPILFAQKRNGLNGVEFNCLKFRTMRPDKNNNKKPTERDDPRVTKLGKILRKTSLDELPQFINVLKGEMSIVGPRPHMVSENESYAEVINRYALRHYVKPGITGLAQVKGYRGAVDSDKDMEMRIRTDIYYVRNWSFLLDLWIVFKTVKLMIVGDENAI